MDREDYKKQYIERTQRHIDLVNQYAAKIGRSYPHHDDSKLNPEKLLDAYYIYSVPKEERSKQEEDALDMATLIHISSAPHHPEYWTDTNLSGFTRTNYTPNGIIDATEMPEEALEEMVMDWNAMSFELQKNTPMEWFNSVNGKRWLFTEEQQQFIIDLINKVWNGFDEV